MTTRNIQIVLCPRCGAKNRTGNIYCRKCHLSIIDCPTSDFHD